MDWRISARNRTCARCEREFEPGAEVVSAIYDEGSELSRRDFCESCWRPAEDAFSFWRHDVPLPEEPRMADRSALMGIFRNLSNAEDDRKRDFRYVLALALMRRKALRPVSSRTEGDREVLELRYPPDDSLHQVEVRPMTQDRMQALVSEVNQVLHIPGEEQPAEQTGTSDEEGAQ